MLVEHLKTKEEEEEEKHNFTNMPPNSKRMEANDILHEMNWNHIEKFFYNV